MTERSSSVADCLRQQLERAGEALRSRLAGLTDAEFFWQPVPGCWTIRPHRGGEDYEFGPGPWIYDYANSDPEPPPFTTLGWRLVHIGSINDMFFEHVFGPGRRDYSDQPIPHDAVTAVAWWSEGLQRFVAKLAKVEDEDLGREVVAPWGVSRRVDRWVQVVVHENVHHGAEIGLLRDLYRETFPRPDEPGPPAS